MTLLDSATTHNFSNSRPKIIQALCVLVAEVETGSWIQAGEPNFALFSRATRTIQSLLNSVLVAPPNSVPSDVNDSLQDGWDPFASLQPWEFELDFWANLAEHPTLLS